MNRYKYLLENIGFLSISRFGSKFLIFFLIPLYTSVLTTEEYGSFDFINTTVSLLIPIITLKIMESVTRFSLDEENTYADVLSVGINIYIKGLIVVIALLVINHLLHISIIMETYSIQFFLLYASSVAYQMMSNFSRGMEKVKVLAIAGLLLTFFTICFNLLFLLVLKWGIYGYFFAIILGYFFATAYIFVALKGWKYIKFKSINIELKGEMKRYSTPLVINSLSWWVNSAADRYTIIALCGVATNGVYSIASKIPSILDSFQTVFSEAWVLSAVKEIKGDESKTHFFSNVYSTYNAVMCLVCSSVIFTSRLLAWFLYAKEFYVAWKYVPFLTIAVLFGALSGFFGGVFASIKDSKTNAKTTAIGAGINIILNIILVYYFKAIGASIATMVSFIIVWIIRLFEIKKVIPLNISYIRDTSSYAFLILQSSILLCVENPVMLYSAQLVCVFIQLILFKSEITAVFRKMKGYKNGF